MTGDEESMIQGADTTDSNVELLGSQSSQRHRLLDVNKTIGVPWNAEGGGPDHVGMCDATS